MASEYLKWKYRDVKPDAPIQLTKQQRAANWWHYHKWWLLVGALLLAALVDIGLNALSVGKVEPDYQVAYVASLPPDEEALEQFRQTLTEMGEDCNGDGQVTVVVNRYIDMAASPDNDQPQYAYAAGVRLMADLEACESYFFICDDYETLHANYDILARSDGAIAGPADAVDVHPLEPLPGLSLARRGFWGDRVCKYREQCDALWAKVTEG